MVKTARTIDEVLPDFMEFVGDAPVIAYSARFDQRFLEYHGRAQGATLSSNEWICALKMARRSPLTGPFALGNVAEKLGIQSSKGHRASADCEVTLEIYERLYEMLEGDITIVSPRKTPRGPRKTTVRYDADLSGQVFVFSGFRDEVLAARIGNAGGRVAGGISRKVTTLLVEDERERPTGKVRKATDYGIPIREKVDFEREFYIHEAA